MLQDVIYNSLMPLLQSLLVALITIGVGFAISYIKSKKKDLILKANQIKDEDKRNAALYAIDAIDNVLNTNIVAMNDTAKKIKNADLTTENRKEELAKLAETVKNDVIAQLSESIKNESSTIINDLDGYIAKRLEKNLDDLKKESNYLSTGTIEVTPLNPIKTTDEPQAILLSNTKEDNSVKEVSMNDVVIEDK